MNQYNELSNEKIHFIVTPSELRMILKDFHHVVVNTGVKKNYIESNTEEFFCKFEKLYEKLKNGEKLIWNNDFDIASFSTGITAHLENCIYQPTNRLSIPNFIEPCPFIDIFNFLIWKETVSTAFAVHQNPENVCGLCLYYPSKIEYLNDTEKHLAGIVDCQNTDDFETFEVLVSRIKSITKLLKLEYNGKIHRTSVRISEEAKKDFLNFYFITSNNVIVL